MFNKRVTQRFVEFLSRQTSKGQGEGGMSNVLSESAPVVLRVPDAARGAAWWCERFDAAVIAIADTGDLTSVLLSLGRSRTVVLLGGPGAMEYYAPPALRAQLLSVGDFDFDPWGNPLPAC
ncbi:hypothetical protein [uncultured Leifsonia sp.]|uniref:hypothetical protein n=1 Tax=uncultured Leifsonia sp. TaxID=340359 RepID=UPI0028D8B98E|nr:hypothetical protein [uncultured Leifsonia sp.]